MSAIGPRASVTAVLGPTNTGKTHFAIERLLAHRNGVIGFPLRLLARENYDRVVRLKGARDVALVTGEEKIVPARARYFLCTAESMPLERGFDFLAVDEIQMCADGERGHVFTDRLQRARGEVETMLLGADTMRPLIRKLVPDAEFVGRPRLSRLAYGGAKKLTRLPPRSAAIAFSAGRVYEIAELLRRQRGGAAIVLGALSPRTRNAQVAMYQDGEVDFLVATDAIGMGLNMRLDHVAFFERKKFDGRLHRELDVAELAQIAGRAGRYMNDGTFGTTGGLGAFEPEIVEAIESHSFKPLTALQWRNAALEFRSPEALLESLDAAPPRPELVRARESDDRRALGALLGDGDIRRRAGSPAALQLLWEVCQIPDYRKTMAEEHTSLLATVFGHLSGPEERLPADWIAGQIAGLDRTDGEIDTLMARIAHVRTWTYIAHRADWLDDGKAWQARARSIEDRLSDALHDRLAQRFVDRRAALLNRARGRSALAATVDADGTVRIAGEPVGRIEGLRFAADTAEGTRGGPEMRPLADRAVRRSLRERAAELADDGDDAFALRDDAGIAWRGAVVARLATGASPLAPRIELRADEGLGTDPAARARRRIEAWLAGHLGADLAPLFALRDAGFAGAARGLVFQLVEALGSLPRRDVRSLIADLPAADRRRMRALGVRFGMEAVYLPALVKPRAARLRALLWSIHGGRPPRPAPPPGLCSVVPDADPDPSFYAACGFRLIGGTAIRIDILDRLAISLARAARDGPFELAPGLLSGAGLSAQQAGPVLNGLGYRLQDTEDGARYVRAAPGRAARGRRERGPGKRRNPSSSPFAKLRSLKKPV
ncbi:MAG: helicase-related protein [Defluviicoccus sp.]|nr:helicase-related protein [Defluviicoccus sp.]